jgi:hypothetical protein
MADPSDSADDRPLDPEVLRVQQRLRRLMLISGLTLGLGILFVFLAIVYRIATHEGSATPVATIEGAAVPTIARAALGLPADARLVSTALDGDRLALTYASGSEETTLVIDLGTMGVINRLAIRRD